MLYILDNNCIDRRDAVTTIKQQLKMSNHSTHRDALFATHCGAAHFFLFLLMDHARAVRPSIRLSFDYYFYCYLIAPGTKCPVLDRLE
jgi:hypothetical protein